MRELSMRGSHLCRKMKVPAAFKGLKFSDV
jgi:hypothetical protein